MENSKVSFTLFLKNRNHDGKFFIKFGDKPLYAQSSEVIFTTDSVETGIKMFRIEDVKAFTVKVNFE